MHGLGNDFVMIDCLETPPPPQQSMSALSEAICDRHFGVGGDGLILILPDESADYRMRMWNPDGSESEMCGNGIRCFGKYLFDAGLVGESAVSVATTKGLQHIEILAQGQKPGAHELMVRVDMGVPRLQRSQIPMIPDGADKQVISEPLVVGDTTYHITGVSMGNPHVVIFVDDVETVALRRSDCRSSITKRFPSARMSTSCRSSDRTSCGCAPGNAAPAIHWPAAPAPARWSWLLRSTDA
jgi:diaminopimelate epimerase